MDLQLQNKIKSHSSALCRDSNGGNIVAQNVINLHRAAIRFDSQYIDVENLRKAFNEWLSTPSKNRVQI